MAHLSPTFPLSQGLSYLNLLSANICPDVIDQELVDEVMAGHMLGPFTLSQVMEIFGSFFCCPLVGLVEKIAGDSNWQMICHLSKRVKDSNSTNDWINSDDFPTTYFMASWVTQFVSNFLTPFSPSLCSLLPCFQSMACGHWCPCHVAIFCCPCPCLV